MLSWLERQSILIVHPRCVFRPLAWWDPASSDPPFTRTSVCGSTRQAFPQPLAAIWFWWLTSYGGLNMLFPTNLAAECTEFEPQTPKFLSAASNWCSKPPKLCEFSCQIYEEEKNILAVKKNQLCQVKYQNA